MSGATVMYRRLHLDTRTHLIHITMYFSLIIKNNEKYLLNVTTKQLITFLQMALSAEYLLSFLC